MSMSTGPTPEKPRLRLDASDIAIAAGALLFVAGAGWIYPPAALLIAGAALVFAGVQAG